MPSPAFLFECRWESIITHVICSGTTETTEPGQLLIDMRIISSRPAATGGNPRGVWEDCPMVTYTGVLYTTYFFIDPLLEEGDDQRLFTRIIHDMAHVLGIG